MLIMNGYIIALDQGTTSSRSIIFDSKGNIVSLAQYPFTQIYPKPGWVEHDPMVILESQMLAMSEAFEKSGLSPTDIAGIGITNQRETTIVWDKNTGKPIYNAIVWQCRRTAPICDLPHKLPVHIHRILLCYALQARLYPPVYPLHFLP